MTAQPIDPIDPIDPLDAEEDTLSAMLPAAALPDVHGPHETPSFAPVREEPPGEIPGAWYRHPIEAARRRLREVAGGGDPTPLLILFLLFFFDEADTGAFNTLAPNIKAAFDLSDQAYGSIVVVNLAIVLLFAIPVGHIGDRVKRVAMVVIGAVMAGTFSFATGVVTTALLLVVARIGNGIGRLMNDPIHTSLLTDWYKPFDRPRVFAFHRNAQNLGAVAGALIAGTIGSLFGWRWAFIVLVVPILAVGLWATRLKEPKRGATDGGAEPLEPLPFGQAVKATMRIRTLRRAYLAAVIVGGGLVPLAVLAPLFLDEVFGMGDFGRGLVTAANAGATLIGMTRSGKWTQGWMVKGMGEPLRRAGLLVVLVGIEIGALAWSPHVAVYVALGLAANFTAGIFLPPLVATQAFVAPARVRSLVLSFSAIFFVIGAGVFFASPLGSLSDNVGIRWGLFASAPFWILGGLVAVSASKFVPDDVAAAFAPD